MKALPVCFLSRNTVNWITMFCAKFSVFSTIRHWKRPTATYSQFADQKAHDNGEFFTPISIVETIANVIEPTRGKVIDPACGSGGMFVQSAHFVEAMRASPNENLTFYGMEKNPTTIRLAKMNLAVHGMEGNIQQAISYYEDPHRTQGPFDYVMANPPFNVDEIDAEKMKDDPRLSFGLPGVNKGGKISNGNYVWISLFHSYLSDQGRAGIVMSSQASSSGGDEAKVREALIKSGDVDIMLAIRSNFFYTRTVPCELWFFDRAKPKCLRDKILMLDARQVFRKVTRKIYDFSPEQMHNLAAIIWLYRGEKKRFAKLVQGYLSTARSEAQSAEFAELLDAHSNADKYFAQHTDTAELKASINKLKTNAKKFVDSASNLPKPSVSIASLNATWTEMQAALNQAKTLIQDIEEMSKRAQKAQEATAEAGETASKGKKLLGALNKARAPLTGDPSDSLTLTGSLKRFCYFEGQADWLLSRFPEGNLRDVEGLVKLVNRKELAANDYSLTPGRYVGVASEKDDESFNFKETIKEIHDEIASLNVESVKLAKTISKNVEELIK